MARVKLHVSKDELTKAINEAEKDGPFPNRDQLHKAVEASKWAQEHKPKPITASVVMLRIQEFGIEPETTPGRKRKTNTDESPSGDPILKRPKTRKEKINNPNAVRIFENLLKEAPTSFHRTIKQAAKGSMAAAVKLKCAQCVGFDHTATNVRECSTNDCPIWAIRPYQNITIEGNEADDAIYDDADDILEEEEIEA